MGRIVTRFVDEFEAVRANGIRIAPKNIQFTISSGVTVEGYEYEFGDSDDVQITFGSKSNIAFITDDKMVDISLPLDPFKTYVSALYYFRVVNDVDFSNPDSYILVYPKSSIAYPAIYENHGNDMRYPALSLDDYPSYTYFDGAVYLFGASINSWINGKHVNNFIKVYDYLNDNEKYDVTEFVKNHESILSSATYNGDKPLYITYDSRQISLTGNGMTFKTGGSGYLTCALYCQGKQFKIADAGAVTSDDAFITVNGVKAGLISTGELINYSIEGQSYVELGIVSTES